MITEKDCDKKDYDKKDCNNWKKLWYLKKIAIIEKDHVSNKINLVVM